MGKRILRVITKYGVLQIAVVGAVLFALYEYIDATHHGFGSRHILFFRVSNSSIVGLAGTLLLLCWCIICALILMQTIYRSGTGRSYWWDRVKYRRNWFYLYDYFRNADPHVCDTDQFPDGRWYEQDGIILAELPDKRKTVCLPSDAEANIFVVGPPGSRKTTGIAQPTGVRHAGSVLAIDIKGDIYNFCHKHRRILRFCPDVKDALKHSSHFNPFAGIGRMTETVRKIYIGNMALTLIPDEPGEGGNFFPSRGRKLFCGIVHFLFSLKPSLTFPDVVHAVLHHRKPEGVNLDPFPEDVFQWVTVIMKSSCIPAIEQVSSLYGNNEKNISGAWDTLATALVPFSNDVLDVLLDGNGPCISAEAMEQGYDVYLQVDQKNLKTYAPLFTMILNSFMQDFTNRPDTSTPEGRENRPFLCLLDEFPRLTFSYDMIDSFLSTLRSKSVQCMLIGQSCSQLSRKYPNDGWRAILGNCNYQMILKSSDEITQKHFSNLFGTRKALKISNSIEELGLTKSTRTAHETREPVFQPEDFGDMGMDIYIYYDGKRIEGKKIISYEDSGQYESDQYNGYSDSDVSIIKDSRSGVRELSKTLDLDM